MWIRFYLTDMKKLSLLFSLLLLLQSCGLAGFRYYKLSASKEHSRLEGRWTNCIHTLGEYNSECQKTEKELKALIEKESQKEKTWKDNFSDVLWKVVAVLVTVPLVNSVLDDK